MRSSRQASSGMPSGCLPLISLRWVEAFGTVGLYRVDGLPQPALHLRRSAFRQRRRRKEDVTETQQTNTGRPSRSYQDPRAFNSKLHTTIDRMPVAGLKSKPSLSRSWTVPSFRRTDILTNPTSLLTAVIALAFVLAMGFLLVILSCALWSNWLPLLVGT